MKISKRHMRKILESYDYDQDYVMHPTDYVRGAMSLLTPQEFNSIGIEKMMREGEVAAMELRNNWPEDEGFGSSDRTYELQSFLEMLGFKTGFPGGTLEVVREGKIKVTKSKLMSMIREEKKRILKESNIPNLYMRSRATPEVLQAIAESRPGWNPGSHLPRGMWEERRKEHVSEIAEMIAMYPDMAESETAEREYWEDVIRDALKLAYHSPEMGNVNVD